MDVSPICFDLETTGLPNAAEFLEPVTPDARLKDPDKIKADIEAKTEARLEKLALDWNVGRVVAFGWWIQDTGTEVWICRNEEDERKALELFWLKQRHRTLVGFNIKGFDLRFLVQRSRYLGVPYPQLDFSKYSRKGIEDLYLLLTFGDGTYDQGAMRRTLTAFCRRFGLPCDDATSGKDIPKLVEAGDWAAVEAHLRSDVELTVALAKRLGLIQSQPVADVNHEMPDPRPVRIW